MGYKGEASGTVPAACDAAGNKLREKPFLVFTRVRFLVREPNVTGKFHP